ncbi:MAG: diguanylate cyclase [Enterobacterales bacterium]|jgi:diguanylate cyclase
MTNKKGSSFLSGLLGRNKGKTTETEVADKTLLTCLHNLSTIGEGRDKKVDREIQTFKKMVKIGTSTIDLQNQVTIITKALTLAEPTNSNNKLIEQFKLMPAEILLDEFISQPISDDIKLRIQNYRASLSNGTLAPDTISDLIDLLEPLKVTPIASEQPVNIKAAKIKLNDIARPLLELFSQIDLSTSQNEALKDMTDRSNAMHELDELCLFIDDICQLILSYVSSSAGRFESFLTQLKQRLNTVNSCINENNETSLAISDCSKIFSECVSTEIKNIQVSLADPSDLAGLEKTLSSSLETIVDGICSFDDERKSLEQDSAKRIKLLQDELTKTQTEAEHLKENLQQQQDRALTDPLTQLPNRHAYNERLNLEYNRWRRYNKPLCLVMGDIDLFKEVNDTYGHLAGDTALRETAKILKNGIRSTDFVARFGGEEFVILMPETKIKDATIAINQIRKSIQAQTIQEGSNIIQLTISFGVATFEKDDNFSNVFARADKALYRAKDKGRNHVCVQMKKED